MLSAATKGTRATGVALRLAVTSAAKTTATAPVRGVSDYNEPATDMSKFKEDSLMCAELVDLAVDAMRESQEGVFRRIVDETMHSSAKDREGGLSTSHADRDLLDVAGEAPDFWPLDHDAFHNLLYMSSHYTSTTEDIHKVNVNKNPVTDVE